MPIGRQFALTERKERLCARSHDACSFTLCPSVAVLILPKTGTGTCLSLFLVCPSGLEPEPKASEAFMVSNSTTGTFLTILFYYVSTAFCKRFRL